MSTEERESKTKILDKKDSKYRSSKDVATPTNQQLSPEHTQKSDESPIEVRSTISQTSSTTKPNESSPVKESDTTIGNVLSFLLPESIFNLWPSAGKKGAEEPWVPTDPNEIVNFPEKELASFDRIFPPDNVESPFQVRRGPITARNMLEQLNAMSVHGSQEHLTTQEEILCHLLFMFVDGSGQRRFLSIYRSENADDVVELCQRCRDCCRLFRYIDKRKEDPADFVRKLLDSFRRHMLWRSAHIAALIGMSEFFLNADEQNRNRLINLLSFIMLCKLNYGI
ncbi:unnamed protein product [Toxocara canis]|uniref:FH2 domain-containing protein n=1 Tax=Toxocara canis TaxID=6265 RepID=A0A183U1C8_TOXCA|nr:unnamed protein product [Toxocara canis]